MDFASWDHGLRQDELEHHGIKGMAWGVRRYQNEDGSLTPAGRERYGVEATKNTSAIKMAKDFNRLDKGYANVVADHKMYADQTAYYSRKANKAKRRLNEKKAQKLFAKALKAGQKAALTNQQKKAIESLQWKIIGKAASSGYTTSAEAVKRTGVNRYGRVMSKISGPFGAASYKAANSMDVDGQQVYIKKRGDGKTRVINYANANKIASEERELERRRRMAGVYRG